jgi:hypothetical protein
MGGYMLDIPYWTELMQVVKASPNVVFWTYCHDVHKLVEFGISYAQGTIPKNLHILASCHDLNEREAAKAHGFKTARVISDKTERVAGEALCPYDSVKGTKKAGSVTCSECTLCFTTRVQKDICFVKS